MHPSDAHRLAPGTVVDDFLVEAVVAEGGTTTTCRAKSQSLGRDVALKHFHSETFIGDGGANLDVARKAASAVARLEHPAITPVFAAGEWNGGLYVASAEPGGPTLEAMLSGDLPTPERTAEIVASLAGALEHAHAAGIIHRDLRPACVTIGRWGNVLLRDFGVTRASGRTGLLTRADVMASLRYTAPEVILGRAPTPATDTYGLAATAIAALTGAPPYADRPPAKYVMLRTSAPPPRLTDASGHDLPGMSEVFAAAMALDPEARPTPLEFATQLQQAVDGLPAALRTGPAPLRVRELEPADDTAPLSEAQPAASAVVPPPGKPLLRAGDVTRIEQRRPVLQAAAPKDARVRWQTWATVLGFAAVFGATAALVAFLTAPGPAPAIRAGTLEVTPPSGWQQDAGGAPIVRLAGGGTARLAVAPVALPGAPLASDLVGRTAPAPARAGNHQVVIYDGGDELTVALPTTKGTLYARCSEPVGTERCAALVSQRVEGADPVAVTPDGRATEALRSAMTAVQQQGAIALSEMTAAKAEGRANGATSLAGVLRNAADGLAVDGLDPGTAAAMSQVAKALAAEAGALTQFASALDRKSASGQRAARASALAADVRLRAALDRFKTAGYEVKG